MPEILKPTQGKFVLEGNVVGEFVDGTLTVTINNADTTKVGESWSDFTELGRSWTYDFTVNYEPTNTAQAAIRTAMTTGDAAFGTLQVYGSNAGYIMSGSGKLTTSTITKAVGSPDQLTGSFQGNGALAYAAS